MRSIIEVKDLTAGYDQEAILEKIDFSIFTGEISVILGISGCGKSTLLKTLVGLIPPISGEVTFNGERVDYLSETSLHNLYRQIGVLYQNTALFNSLNLYDNIALPIKMHYPEFPKEIEKEMVLSRLAQVGLLESWEKFPAELSGGMRKRAALARAMILDPEIIFCDEPLAGLDPIKAGELYELIQDLRELLGITFVVVTHEIRAIEKISDRILVIRNGKLYFQGEYRELFSTQDHFLETFFLRNKK